MTSWLKCNYFWFNYISFIYKYCLKDQILICPCFLEKNKIFNGVSYLKN